MPVVPCPHCTNPVTLPPTWGGAAYTCPHCRRVAGGSPPPPPRPVAPTPVPPPSLAFPEDSRDPDPPRRYRQPSGNPVGDFFTFRLMITPILIQIVFWLGTIGCVLSGGSMILTSLATSSSDKKGSSDANDVDHPSGKAGAKNAKTPAVSSALDSWSLISGVLTLVFGPLILRIWAELVILLFKIHDELKAANDRRGRG